MPTSSLLTTTEAAAVIGVSLRRLQAMITSGKLPAVKHGRDWFIVASDLDRMKDRKPGRPRKDRTMDNATLDAKLAEESEGLMAQARQLDVSGFSNEELVEAQAWTARGQAFQIAVRNAIRDRGLDAQ